MERGRKVYLSPNVLTEPYIANARVNPKYESEGVDPHTYGQVRGEP